MQNSEEQNEQYDIQEESNKINALSLTWTVGLNFNIMDGVHYLTNQDRKEIFYAVGHTGVIFDYQNNTQRLLQGHCNKITCTAYYRDKRDPRQEDYIGNIIITADVGPDSMLVVWDAVTGVPRKTIDDPHKKGTQALDISPDGRYIVTLSRDENRNAKNQIVTVWEWQSDNPEKISSFLDSKIKPEEYQDYIRFNPSDQNEFVTTGKTIIFFWNWESSEKGFTYYEPATLFSLRQKYFTQTAFIPGNTQAVTGTEDGFIVVWDISLIMEDFSQPEERRAIKVVNLMNTAKKSDSGLQREPCSINILKIEQRYLVIGSSNGDIRFYDFQYRIIAWFEHIGIGSITTISFAEQSSIQDESFKYDDQLKDEQSSPTFKCADFIVVDLNARISQLNYSLFGEIDKDKKSGNILLQSIVKPIVSISVRPNSQELAIFCNNGYLYQWNFQEKNKQLTLLKIIESDDKEKETTISACIDYSPDGQYLSVADSRGKIHICDMKLKEELDKKKQKEFQKDKEEIKEAEEKKKYRDPWQQPVDVTEADKCQKKPRVQQQIFSPLQEVKMEVRSSDNKIIETKQLISKYLATMDDDYGVCLFVLDYKLFDKKNEFFEWQYVGKCRVHYAAIRSISFGETIDDNGQLQLKLFSVAEDMKMAEYNIIDIDSQNKQNYQSSDFVDRLKLNSIFPIEQECIPTACIWYPINKHKEDILLVVNDDYKIKLWQIMKGNLKGCKKCCLGPTYGGAINKLLVLNPNEPQSDYQDKYLAYSTAEKIIGIIKLPLEGNPNHTMGLIAHSDKITGISATQDGKFFFTSGYDDYAVNIWQVNVQMLEKAFTTDPNLDPFPSLLEGGEDGQTHADLKDFFYYSQIRSKNEHTTKARKLDGKVPLSAIPYMMRSMGHYPTQKEVENMINEVQHSKYLESGEQVLELDLKMFLKLFVNHRPVYGISKQQIQDALNILSEKTDNKGQTSNESKGLLNREEFLEILQKEGEKMTLEEIKQCLDTLLGEGQELPDQIDANQLSDEILGFEDLEQPVQEEQVQQENIQEDPQEQNQEN